MTKRAVEHIFNGTTSSITYDSTKTTLGKCLTQTTFQDTQSWAGPYPISMTRPAEIVGGLNYQNLVYAISQNATYDWVFTGDRAAAATTRKIHLYTYNKSTFVFDYKGFVNLATFGGGNKSLTGLAVSRYLYTTGTVGVSGTAVTGTDTAWTDARYATGARIGFGTTDPDAVTQWYEIATITDNTHIVLVSSAGTITAGTSYVIDELRIIAQMTSSTAAEGGLYLVKGLNFSTFDPTGPTISMATNVDNVRRVYLLQDDQIGTNLAGIGIAVKPVVSDTEHIVYHLNADNNTTAKIFGFNIRDSLSVTSGQCWSAWVLTTTPWATYATMSACNNCSCFATPTNQADHNEASLFFVDAGNFYQIYDSSIGDGATISGSYAFSFFDTDTIAQSNSSLRSVRYDANGEHFLLATLEPYRDYVVKYYGSPDASNRVWSVNSYQFDQVAGKVGKTQEHPKKITTNQMWTLDGMCYITQSSASITTNTLYTLPIGADWAYASGLTTARYPRLITPSLDTTGASKLLRVCVNNARILGESNNLGIVPEPFRVYARTSGISDNSGSWTLIGRDGDITLVSLTATNEIQLMFEFRIYGLTCVPARIYSACVVYEDSSTDSHYAPSANLSDLTNKLFAWKFTQPFGSSVPSLRVRLYDAEAGGAALVDDNTGSPTGTFEKSTNGTTWANWTNTDKANDTTYIRYTPDATGMSAIDGKRIKAWLSLL